MTKIALSDQPSSVPARKETVLEKTDRVAKDILDEESKERHLLTLQLRKARLAGKDAPAK
jgi:hypothetical protein